MLEVLLVLWIVLAMLIVFENKAYRIIVYFGIFSLITAVCYLFLGAPDVAMAEAGISAFSTIFFVICIERYYGRKGQTLVEKPISIALGKRFAKIVLPLTFTIGLFVLFIHFMPDTSVSTYLKELYLLRFMEDIGGQNAVNAILAGYRVYDTLFEALILVISVVAVSHMSWSDKTYVSDGRPSDIEGSKMAVLTMRIICPLILLFGAYIIANGHISAGGGFQGGLAVASFFICRYFIYDIYDIPVKKVIKLEELIFINIIVAAIIAIFVGAAAYLPAEFREIYQGAYLLTMNILIGLKVACGFFILFYRYIAIERGEETNLNVNKGVKS
ncbi:MAG: DUF4040 domain-containing protein [Defluviitaleaceae bacterium]|nr:DUF4040 domain-containing protein [Defluviitaleaceae bacterium]